MKFVSWNVNGLRACMNKGFMDTFYALNADFFCLQETKLQQGQVELDLPGYQQFWCYAEKKGYSGTAIFTKHTPLSVSYGLGVPELDTEGRLITLEYEEFYLVNCYTPNAQRGLARINHRLRWEESLRAYLKKLDACKPVIYCGDLNVAHKEIDLKNPSSNRGSAGFSDEERSAFDQLLDSGFADSFRHLYPDKTGAYSWWSYMFNARQNNAGWRIDYFLVSNRLADSIHDATIHPDILGSDHCPVGLDLNITCNGGIWSPEVTMPEKQEQRKADGESPAGHIHRFISLAFIFTIALLLLVPTVWLLGPDENPIADSRPSPDETTSQTDAKPVNMMCEVIDRTGTVIPMLDTTISTSSYLRQYLTNGDESWDLVDSHFFLGSYIRTDDNEYIEPNYYVQLIFDPAFHFTYSDVPIVDVTMQTQIDTTGEQDCVFTSYYYGEDRSYAGVFLYGYVSNTTVLNITVQYDTAITYTYVINITPNKDLSNYSTEQLVSMILSSGKIQLCHLDVDPNGSFEMMISSDLYIHELTTRPDAVSVLLDYYESNRYSIFACPSALLKYEPFLSLMTDDEKERYNEITEQRSSLGHSNEIVYG